MKIQRLARGSIKVETFCYTLEFRPSETLVLLWVKGTHQRHMLFFGGACNPVGRRDETIGHGKISLKRDRGTVLVSFAERSSVWENKLHTYVCGENSIEVFYVIKGHGVVDRALFFRGYLHGEERGMASDMDEIYSTAPNFQEKLWFHPGESFSISAGNHLEMPVGAQALASPCYCVGLHDRRDEAYLSVGLATEPGRYTWDSFQWNPSISIPITPLTCDSVLAGGFAAVYDGKLRINGRWESPRLVMTFAVNRDDVLPKYLNHCYRHRYLTRPPRRKPVAWWREPIYCTWHDQNGLASSQVGLHLPKIGLKAFEFCTQHLCERWIKMLDQNGCKPGIVILDATWAKNLNSGDPDPEKWSDMRGWVDSCHRRGIRVFVWAQAWATEGLPLDECITRIGKPVTCDITNPKYCRRFREMIRRWFSDAPDCLNADGIKLDGQLNLPTGKGLRSHGGVWGLELQRLYMKTLYEEAKRYKSDACISTFVLNPHLAEFTDMVRLGDMYTHRPTAHESMCHRAALYRIAMPHAVIDTDGQMHFHALDDYAQTLAEQAKLGVPTLYTAEWMLRTHLFQPMRLGKLKPKDYQAFSKVIGSYRRKCMRQPLPYEALTVPRMNRA